MEKKKIKSISNSITEKAINEFTKSYEAYRKEHFGNMLIAELESESIKSALPVLVETIVSEILKEID